MTDRVPAVEAGQTWYRNGSPNLQRLVIAVYPEHNEVLSRGRALSRGRIDAFVKNYRLLEDTHD